MGYYTNREDGSWRYVFFDWLGWYEFWVETLCSKSTACRLLGHNVTWMGEYFRLPWKCSRCGVEKHPTKDEV